MEMLELYRHGERVARFDLGDCALEVGSAPTCDVVVADATVSARQWLVMRRHGTVFVFDVSRGRVGRGVGLPLARNADFAVGREHVLRRVSAPGAVAPPEREPSTDALPRRGGLAGRLILTLGRGAGARRIALADRCLAVGRAPDSDLVLGDLAVSERHARLEPMEGAVWVRDLGSRNGTYVDGVAVQHARVAHGCILRLGRTDLRVVSPDALESQASGGTRLVAESSEMLHVLADLERMAALPWPVLIVGESGTGKEGIAQALHTQGPRRERGFVAINAGALSRDLIESELFGHERGAFTGAHGCHRGVFEQASGGTLFLDEIAELPLDLQARLLRVLETGEIRRLGAERAIAVDVRLVCATHRDLRAMVRQGAFRQDLYYRIARLVLQVPALRTRLQDVGALARHFLAQISDEIGRRELSEEGLTRLLAYDWPGNARELRNVLCSAAAHSGATIDAADVERALTRLGDGAPVASAAAYREAVAQFGGNKAAAARALGIPRSTLRDRLVR